MNCPINFKQKNLKRIINPYSKFVLIGNTIDGYLDFKFKEFANFEEVKSHLFDILTKIKSNGEWNIALYQVKESYKLKNKYGYFKVPDRGKLIFSYGYCDHPIKQIIYTKDSIQIFETYMYYSENWLSEGDDFHNYELDIEFIRIRIK